MKKWQEERNYRRVRSEGGEVIANTEVTLIFTDKKATGKDE